MRDLFLHGCESVHLLEQQGFLERCVAAHSLETDADSLPDTLEQCLNRGPVDFVYEAIPQDYKPKLRKSEAQGFREEYGLFPPVQVMVASIDNRLKNQKFVSHALAAEIPRSSFIRVGDSVLVARPELALLHSAAKLTKIELAILCSKFFAVYEKSAGERTGVAFRQRLSDYDRCISFLGQCAGANRVNFLREALEFSVYPAASPQEIKMDVLFTWPWRMGAYSLGKACFNYKIDTSSFYKDGRKHIRYLDCYFPEYKIDLEYDGRPAHERRAMMGADAIRHNELAAHGITEFVITKEQIGDVPYLHSVAKSIARAGGFDLPPITRSFEAKQSALIVAIDKML